MDFAQARADLAPGQTVGMATHGDDTGLYVEFRTESVVDYIKSKEQGRTVHQDVPFIKIMFPGDKTKVIDRPAKLENDESGPADSVRFSRQWAQFVSNQEQSIEGLPVHEWAPISKSEANDLKSMGIHTVEQLAALPDSALSWLGARSMQAKAQAWLDRADSGATASRLADENAQLKEQMAAMRKQMDELAALVKSAAPSDEHAATTSKKKG
jgi:hypothetical protein